MVATHEGICIKFSEEEVRTVARDSKGVKAMHLRSDDYLVDMLAVKSGTDILTVSEQGYGKRVDPEEYRLQNRAGKGVKVGIFNEKTGKLVNLKQVTEYEDVMLIADDGVIIRVPAKQVNKLGRTTSGVRIMHVKDGAKIVCVAIADNFAEDQAGDDVNDSMVIPEEEI